MDELQKLQKTFSDIIENNGQESLWFLSAEQSGLEVLLTALNKQVVDEKFNELMNKLIASYREVFALAPGYGNLRSSKLADQQVEIARNSIAICKMAIDRLTEILGRNGE